MIAKPPLQTYQYQVKIYALCSLSLPCKSKLNMHTSGVIQLTAYSLHKTYIRLFLKVYLSRFVTLHFKLDYVAYEFRTKLALDLLQNNEILR